MLPVAANLISFPLRPIAAPASARPAIERSAQLERAIDGVRSKVTFSALLLGAFAVLSILGKNVHTLAENIMSTLAEEMPVQIPLQIPGQIYLPVQILLPVIGLYAIYRPLYDVIQNANNMLKRDHNITGHDHRAERCANIYKGLRAAPRLGIEALVHFSFAAILLIV